MKTILRILPYAVYAVLAGYLAAWLVLLIGCLRRRRFWPVLGSDRRTRWFWLASFVFLNPVLTVLYAVFGRRRPDAKPGRIAGVHVGLAAIVIAIGGFFVNFPGLTHLWMVPFAGRTSGSGDRVHLKAHAATIEANNGINTTTASTSGSHARFACRTIAVVDESGEPLVGLLAAALRDALAELPFVEKADLYAEGRFPPDGHRRPDVFVLLNARNVSVRPVPYAASLRAEISVSVGRSPWRGSASYVDGSDPPLLAFLRRSTIHHESRTVGYESVRHGLAAKNIADAVVNDLQKQFAKWHAKYGRAPELPAGLQGTYRPAELPGPLARLGCKRRFSYAGLLTHNETIWQFQTPTDELAGLLERLCGELKSAGWRKLSLGKTNLRMAKDGRRINIFRGREPVRQGWVVVRPGAKKAPANVYVHYRERFGKDERRAALEGVLAQPAGQETLLFLSCLFDAEQRKRMYAVLADHPHPSPAAQVELIGHYVQEKRHDEATRALRRARALLWSVRNEGDYRSRLNDAAKKLAKATGRKIDPREPPAVEDFRAAGFREIDANTGPFELEVGLDEPVLLFVREPDEGVRTLALRVARPEQAKAPGRYVLKWMDCRHNCRSWSSQPGRSAAGGRWSAQCHWSNGKGLDVRLEVQAADEPGRFRVSVQPRSVPPR